MNDISLKKEIVLKQTNSRNAWTKCNATQFKPIAFYFVLPNQLTGNDAYPLPKIDDTLHALNFERSKQEGLLASPMDPKDCAKTV